MIKESVHFTIYNIENNWQQTKNKWLNLIPGAISARAKDTFIASTFEMSFEEFFRIVKRIDKFPQMITAPIIKR